MKITTTKIIVIILTLLTSGIAYAQGVISLPQTGQTTCLDAAGNVISCSGSGQDGDVQAGVAWPAPRFNDNGDGTITDNLTGLIWLKNANCYTPLNYNTSIVASNELENGKCGLTDGSVAGDWRLPNVVELESLIVHAGFFDSSSWLTAQGFTNVLGQYWSSTNAIPDGGDSGWIYMTGLIRYLDKEAGVSTGHWPVRGSSASQTWKTGQTTCYSIHGPPIDCANTDIPATGQDGDIQAGIEWPAPRFSDNGDGTVTDNLTGLIWLKNANCPSLMTWQGALTYSNNLANGSCGLTDGSVAGDWRLPNRKELFSLVDFGEVSPALVPGHPFTNVQAGYTGYWSSTSYLNTNFTDRAMVVYMYSGDVNILQKAGTDYVWPVRGRSGGPQSESACFDGIDNDQDGVTDCADSDCNGSTDGACSTGQLGICGPGTRTCSGSAEVCAQNNQPQQEGPPGNATCGDGNDNDCDGSTDAADPGCAFPPESNCFDGIDNDQDGVTDCADPDCNGSTDGACSTGQPGICGPGTRTCSGSAEVCAQNNQPQHEGPPGNATCRDGADNDCDGRADAEDPDCVVSSESNCFDGIDNDQDGNADCADPDCNGVTDGACSTGQPGICGSGTLGCSGGAEVCRRNNQPQAEVCDGLDNNCDGASDEGLDIDADGDGVLAPESCSSGPYDCNDNNNQVGVECNTPPSNDPVTVTSADGTVDITYPNVTGGGDTNITVEECNLDQLDGMAMTAPNTPCIDVQTDVQWDDKGGTEWIQVCITYVDTYSGGSQMPLAQEQALEVASCDGTIPPTPDSCEILAMDPDVVPNPNTDTNEICVLTDHFSVFTVGEPLDFDGDSKPDLLDNCRYVSNMWQRDYDFDGVGNACDSCPGTPAGVPVDETGCEIAGDNWKGDMNSDGTVDISDVIRVLRIALGLDAPAVCADINGDSIVDISDVIRTLRMALGLDALVVCVPQP